jgi:hypothetical protein
MTNRCYDSLYERYPKIFANRPIPGGIFCGYGWYCLIDELCAQIQEHVDRNAVEQPTAIQIKEKFGELRFSIQGGDAQIRALIISARHRSVEICEVCGGAGKLLERSNKWLHTRCAAHHEDFPY